MYIDGAIIGETANKTFSYKEITPGAHKLSTESEFSGNVITFQADGGKNYFAEQYIKMGVFVGGAGIIIVPEEEAKRKVLECGLAR